MGFSLVLIVHPNDTRETMENYKLMGRIFTTLDDDLRRFYEDGNAAAGVRARNMLLEIKKLSQEMRDDIQRCKREGKKKK